MMGVCFINYGDGDGDGDGDWWLMIDDWWLMIDDWWLMIDDWWLMMMNDDDYKNISKTIITTITNSNYSVFIYLFLLHFY